MLTVRNGWEALEMLQSFPIEITLIDLHMGFMSSHSLGEVIDKIVKKVDHPDRFFLHVPGSRVIPSACLIPRETLSCGNKATVLVTGSRTKHFNSTDYYSLQTFSHSNN